MTKKFVDMNTEKTRDFGECFRKYKQWVGDFHVVRVTNRFDTGGKKGALIYERSKRVGTDT